MSSGDVSIQSDITANKPKRNGISWFSRRRRSMFSRFRRCSSKKQISQSTTLSVDSFPAAEADTSKDEAGTSFTIIGEDHEPTGSAKRDSKNIDMTATADNNNLSTTECPLCLITQPNENFPILSTCQHRSCITCLRQYLTIEISESRVNLMCPECQEKLHPNDMKLILENDPHLMEKWEEFTLRRALSVDPDCRWCPAPDCGFAVIAYGCASCPKLICERPACKTEFCYHCRQEWHHNQTCDSAHMQRRKQLRLRSNSSAYSQGSSFHDEMKPCPKCGALIVKMNDGSCNHMTCTVCEAEFCWLCLQEITDLHYLSPSGCTFWGKKPWSKKKKILWQLGLLIGAPLGIGLVAGVAVPAIIIGLPVWVGKKVKAHFQNRDVPKYKQIAVIAIGTTASFILSPVLAALAVGIGVPLMLVYVYGVVPISLCRTGSYGLRDEDSGPPGVSMLPSGFRLGTTSGQAGTSSAEDNSNFHGQSVLLTSQRGLTNPSIGEASVGGMTMGSFNTSRGSNIDKVGRVDQDVASTVAVAGTSITGSVSGVSGVGPLGSNKVDIQTKDVDQHSTYTQISNGSASNYASVQVHMNDNVSEHSTSSYPSSASASGNTIRKSYSSKPIGAKRKTEHAKRSASIHTMTASKGHDESHGLPTVTNTISDHTLESLDRPTALTIVNECDTSQVKKVISSSPGSNSSTSLNPTGDSTSHTN